MIDWGTAVHASREQVRMFGAETEACGYIEDSRVVVCRNVSKRAGQFALSDDDCIAVYDAMERGTLNGVWHSHPGGTRLPSLPDWDNQPRGVSMYIIVLDGYSEEVLCFRDEDRLCKIGANDE